ncbi:microcin C transport system substrate-binding protein [Methylovirgula ligni]|uniref:Microcin C transport system substrate-binding protein n=1 Tax=Methylovirgula ligni TaxID=569860 RepID=A0A3D9YYH9_9HYPH|nr:extracellular solute-binding protein [Methylovirgula ligni]REF87813.1 microcin C transport system substrate-binding protein [Methylovirgula ligni]
MTSLKRPVFSRRSALQLCSGFLGTIGPLRPFRVLGEAAPAGAETYGLSIFGDLALPPDFKSLAYVNPQAPKGGEIALQPTGGGANVDPTTFDSFNVYILKGDGASGMGAVFDSLMAGNSDEPDALYGLVAKKVWVSADKLTYRFFLRKEARFHDGAPLTAHDVVFSLNILKQQGHPAIAQSLRDLDSATAEADDVVTVKLKKGRSREAALIVAGQPIFSAAYYGKHAFNETTLEPPLGSGPYKVGSFDAGHFIVYERIADYWGKDLPLNVGQNNFDRIRFEYFADRKVAFEAFKAGVFTFREEFTSAVWSTQYTFAAVKDGRIKRETLPDQLPLGTQAWFLNIRRDKFKDIRIREALEQCFDFEWTNRNIMYGLYHRTVSYFQNSPMMASGKPSPEELAILSAFKAKLPEAVFGDVPVPPVSDGSGEDRTLLRKANDLLLAAGCKRDGANLLLPDGKPFEIEFLDFDNALEPHTAPFIRNLNLLGITARFRTVDPAQYKQRTDNFDYDIVTSRFGLGLTPGEAMRAYFGSQTANLPGSYNISGIADPVIDALIEQALTVDTREKLTYICRCIDRILRCGHYWVPMWNKPNHLVAYWDVFSRPARSAKYDIGVVSTWWYDTDKAARVHLPGH